MAARSIAVPSEHDMFILKNSMSYQITNVDILLEGHDHLKFKRRRFEGRLVYARTCVPIFCLFHFIYRQRIERESREAK